MSRASNGPAAKPSRIAVNVPLVVIRLSGRSSFRAFVLLIRNGSDERVHDGSVVIPTVAVFHERNIVLAQLRQVEGRTDDTTCIVISTFVEPDYEHLPILIADNKDMEAKPT